jgi:hypothetical protein
LVIEYEAGADMKALATRWDLHRTTVAGHLRQADVRLRRHGMPSERLDEAVRLYGEGWSCQRLAERYRCDDETVRQALLRAGVKLRAPWQRTWPSARVIPLLDAVPPIRGRRGRPRRRPRKLFADRGYDHHKCRRQLRARGITPRIARRGIAHGSGLGRHRWVVECGFA